MKPLVVLALLLLVPCLASAAPTTPGAPGALTAPELEALRASIQSAIPVGEESRPGGGPALPGHAVVRVERTGIGRDVAHYVFLVRTGPGPHDLIRVHRVVKEPRRNQPMRTPQAVFMLHGDAKDFTGMFLPGLTSPSTPDDFGFAVYAARRGVDVWGMDQAWNVMPQDLADYSFMKDWGLDRQVRDLGIGLTVARLGRLATGSGSGQLLLGGYSSGVMTTLALIGEETQLPPSMRHVRGWIAADLAFKTDDAILWQAVTTELAGLQAAYEAGQYASFVPFRMLGELLACCPGDPSPVVPGFTNEQAAHYFSSAVLYPANFHYWAGDVGPDGLPTDPVLTTRALWLDFLASAAVWEPMKFMIDYEVLWVTEDGPYDDHLAQIAMPVLDLSPVGGFAALTPYGYGMLSAADVQMLFPSAGRPPELDLGHIDIWTWAGSQDLVWAPLVDWIADQSAPMPFASQVETLDPGAATPAAGSLEAGPLAIRAVAPNPAPGRFDVSFTVAASAPARLDVLDVTGRSVWSGETSGPGPQRLSVGRDRPLPAGVYLVRLTQGGLSQARRVAVVR